MPVCLYCVAAGNLKDWAFFAVFDGHAGAAASEYCAKQLLSTIVESNVLGRIDPDTMPTEKVYSTHSHSHTQPPLHLSFPRILLSPQP